MLYIFVLCTIKMFLSYHGGSCYFLFIIILKKKKKLSPGPCSMKLLCTWFIESPKSTQQIEDLHNVIKEVNDELIGKGWRTGAWQSKRSKRVFWTWNIARHCTIFLQLPPEYCERKTQVGFCGVPPVVIWYVLIDIYFRVGMDWMIWFHLNASMCNLILV